MRFVYIFYVELQVESKKISIDLVTIDSKGVLFHAHEFLIQFIEKFIIVEAFTIKKIIEKVIQEGGRKLQVAKNIVDIVKEKYEDYLENDCNQLRSLEC